MTVLLDARMQRRVSAANFMYYPYPSLHPDRVLREHDLIYLLEGGWEICQDGEVYRMEPGDILLLTAGRHHYGQTPCLPGTRTMFLHFSSAPQDDRSPDHHLPIPTLTKASAPGLRRGVKQIINEFFSADALRETRMAALLTLLLCDLSQTPDGAQPQWPVGEVRSILLSQPNVNFTAEQLAGRIGLSERRLRYLFRSACGIPLHRYQLDLRLDMARQLILSEPDRTLTDIAETFGFTDAFHLSHAYKRRFGHAPRSN